MDDKLSINITIAQRIYPMTINRNDEEKIRKAVKVINERILLYQQKYSGKDNQDCLAMATLQFVIQLIEQVEKSEMDSTMIQIDEINKELSGYLKKNNVL
jgi:cell division protein ZapA